MGEDCVLVNLGSRVVAWAKNKTSAIDNIGYCTAIDKLNNQYLLTTFKDQSSTLSTLTITVTKNNTEPILNHTIKPIDVPKSNIVYLQISPTTTPPTSFMALTDKL